MGWEDRLCLSLWDLAGLSYSQLISRLDKEMRAAAKELDFETAAELRDKIRSLRQQEMAVGVKVE